VKKVNNAIHGTVVAKYLICRTLAKADDNLKKWPTVIDQNKANYDSETLKTLGKTLPEGVTTAADHRTILRNVTRDLRKSALEGAINGVVEEFMQEKVRALFDDSCSGIMSYIHAKLYFKMQ
jgi:hypothetical protein